MAITFSPNIAEANLANKSSELPTVLTDTNFATRLPQRVAFVPAAVASEIAVGAGIGLGALGVAAAMIAASGASLVPANGWRSFAQAARASLSTYSNFRHLNNAGKVVAIYRYGHIMASHGGGEQDQVRQQVISMLRGLVKDSNLVDVGGDGRRPPTIPPTSSCTPDGRFSPEVLQQLDQVNPDQANARAGHGADNCIACSIAADVLLRTGQLHSASEYGPLSRGSVESIYNRSWQPSGDSLKLLARYFKTPGSTGLVLFDGRVSQHVFNVFNNCGKVHFYDAQTGHQVDDRNFTDQERGSYLYMRTR